VIPEQVGAMAALCGVLEQKLGLPAGALKIELMIEMPQSIINPSGECSISRFVEAAGAAAAARTSASTTTPPPTTSRPPTRA
jgi:hypothetical protein